LPTEELRERVKLTSHDVDVYDPNKTEGCDHIWLAPGTSVDGTSAPRMAAALSDGRVFSMAPLLILVAGLVLGDDAAREEDQSTSTLSVRSKLDL
jgi:hypothetical protein